MTFEILVALSLLLRLVSFIYLYCAISKLKTRIHMLDDVYTRKENIAAAVNVLEGLIRNLNTICQDHQKRLDILEEGHPDSAIDYGTVDDDGNITEVWFEGKRYVPEDKRNEDTNKLYADNKVVAETTRPEETRCCATYQYYRPGEGHTCALCYWLNVTKTRATTPESACHNYEKAYVATKGEVDYPYVQYKNMGGNGPAEQMAKRVDELQCEIQRLNTIAQFGCTAQELRQRWEELMRNDS